MYAFFVFYEILLIALSLWLIPYLQDTSGDLAVQITFVVLILMSGIVFGAITDSLYLMIKMMVFYFH